MADMLTQVHQIFYWFHEGERKSLGNLTAAVGLAIEKV